MSSIEQDDFLEQFLAKHHNNESCAQPSVVPASLLESSFAPVMHGVSLCSSILNSALAVHLPRQPLGGEPENSADTIGSAATTIDAKQPRRQRGRQTKRKPTTTDGLIEMPLSGLPVSVPIVSSFALSDISTSTSAFPTDIGLAVSSLYSSVEYPTNDSGALMESLERVISNGSTNEVERRGRPKKQKFGTASGVVISSVPSDASSIQTNILDSTSEYAGSMTGGMPSELGQYVCGSCAARFFHISHLQQHTRTHTDVRPYACSFCDERFRQMSHKMQHERIHTDERPYSCDRCGQKFRQSCHVSQHKKRHPVCTTSVLVNQHNAAVV